MTPKEFIDENYFSLTLDCKREINEIYSALEDYAKAKQLAIKESKHIQDSEILRVLVWYQSESEKYRQNTLLVDAVKDFKKEKIK